MAAARIVWNIDDFVNVVGEYRRRNNQSTRKSAVFVLKEHRSLKGIELNRPLNGKFERKLFNALISSQGLSCIMLRPTVDASSAEVML